MRHKIIYFSFSFLFFSMTAFAQGTPPINQPQASPRAEVSQIVGITKISIDYGRPAANEREILGALVPYDQVWRAGANENTRISFDRSVVFADTDIPAGTYSLHMIPGKDNWIVAVNKDHESWGSYFYVEANDAARFNAEVSKNDNSIERLTYSFENITSNGAEIILRWSDFKVTFPIKVNTEEHMLDYIENEYLKHLAGFSWQGFNGAANYTLTNDISLDIGLSWAERSIAMNMNFANMSTKSLILRKQGNVKDAEKLMKEAMPLANEVSLNAYGYALLYNIKDVEAAIEVFQINVKDHPKSWNVYDSLAEALATHGNNKEAVKNYQKALGLAPETQKQRIENTIDGLNG